LSSSLRNTYIKMKAHIANYKCWIASADEKKITPLIDQLLSESGFTVLNGIEYYFEPFGYTRLWLLAESHCAMHTFPEEDKTYIELSSCSETKLDVFCAQLLKSDLYLKVNIAELQPSPLKNTVISFFNNS
jgi:S-adenosylmethionine decarboxylase